MAEYEKRIRAEGRAAAEKAVAAAQPNDHGVFFASLSTFVTFCFQVAFVVICENQLPAWHYNFASHLFISQSRENQFYLQNDSLCFDLFYARSSCIPY